MDTRAANELTGRLEIRWSCRQTHHQIENSQQADRRRHDFAMGNGIELLTRHPSPGPPSLNKSRFHSSWSLTPRSDHSLPSLTGFVACFIWVLWVWLNATLSIPSPYVRWWLSKFFLFFLFKRALVFLDWYWQIASVTSNLLFILRQTLHPHKSITSKIFIPFPSRFYHLCLMFTEWFNYH